MQSKPIQTAIASEKHYNHPRYRDCIGHWILNEGGGLTAYDISGYKSDGALQNTPTWTGGLFGHCLSLNGTNQSILVPDSSLLTLTTTDKHTWSMWIRPNGFTQWSAIWSQEASTTSNFLIYAHTTADSVFGPVTAGVSAGWTSGAGTNDVNIHSSDNVLATNTWAHVVVTYDGALAQASRLAVFVNGRDVTATGDISSRGAIANIDPTATYIGRDNVFASEIFSGRIDDVRYYSRVLSLAEIGSLYTDPFLEFRTKRYRYKFNKLASIVQINNPLWAQSMM